MFFIGTERANTSDSVPSWAKRTANFSGTAAATGIAAASKVAASAATPVGWERISPEFDPGTGVATASRDETAGADADVGSGLASVP